MYSSEWRQSVRGGGVGGEGGGGGGLGTHWKPVRTFYLQQ